MTLLTTTDQLQNHCLLMRNRKDGKLQFSSPPSFSSNRHIGICRKRIYTLFSAPTGDAVPETIITRQLERKLRHLPPAGLAQCAEAVGRTGRYPQAWKKWYELPPLSDVAIKLKPSSAHRLPRPLFYRYQPADPSHRSLHGAAELRLPRKTIDTAITAWGGKEINQIWVRE